MLFGVMQYFFMFSYVSASGEFPQPLKSDEEEYYIKLYEKGDKDAKDTLICRNLRLVAHIAKKYYPNTKDSQELISIGTIGLMKAINSFDSSKNVKLATYAARCIDNEIKMFLRKHNKSKFDLYLQDIVNISDDGSELTLEDKLFDDDMSVEDKTETKIFIEKLNRIIDNLLTDKEKFIISARFGLKNKKCYTQKEIANYMGISRSYVSRIEKRIIKILKKEIELIR